MSTTLAILDGNKDKKYLRVAGAGTSDDPFRPATDPLTATEVASATTDVSGVAAAAGLSWMGYSIRENASSPDTAEVVIRHGDAVNDPALAFISLGGDQSDTKLFDDPIPCADGIFVERVSGETHLVLYTKVVE
jgi:hypothetical protein